MCKRELCTGKVRGKGKGMEVRGVVTGKRELINSRWNCIFVAKGDSSEVMNVLSFGI